MHTITLEHRDPTKAELDMVDTVFGAHTAANGVKPHGYTSLVLNSHKGAEHIAGAICRIFWDWLYIDELWVVESERRHGLGRSLMQKIEDEARKRGLTGLWLATQTWQAPGFYKKMGFEAFGELPDFPKGHTRYFFKKNLKSA